MNKPLLVAKQITKTYLDGQHATEVLRGVSVTVERGEAVAVVGSSGSGKSTLLHILGTLDKPSAGEVELDGINIAQQAEPKLAKLRNQYMGFIYQFHHLLPEFNALENVAMPARIAGLSKAEAEQKAKALLDKVGLSHRVGHYPSQLSGGERQRVAIARALVNNPAIVLADEPTGNLDEKSAAEVYDLMRALAKEQGTAFVVVTHDHSLADKMDRTLTMHQGVLVGDTHA